MSIEEILSIIAPPDVLDYKCFDLLIEYLSTNKEFYEFIVNGIKDKTIKGFDRDLWIKLGKQNIRHRGVDSCLDILEAGANIGACTVMSKQVSYSLDDCFICGGTIDLLKGTKNSPNGEHTWISHKGWILDTTLMLAIDERISKDFGYIEENRINPNQDPIYVSAKEYANDLSLRKKVV